MGLEVAARLQALVGLLEERAPVGDAPDQPPSMDIVERVLLEGPVLGAVIDLALKGPLGRETGN